MANTRKAQLQAEIKRLQEQIRHLEYGTRSVLGKNVLYHRKRLNMTQLDLAQKAEVTRVTIANIELGTSNTSIPCFDEALHHLRCDPERPAFGEEIGWQKN